MNTQEYISSGIIEAYLLGLASDEEARELMLLSEKYPDIRIAMEEAQETLDTFGALHRQQPPAHLKNKIWAAIENEEQTTNNNRSSGHVVDAISQDVPSSASLNAAQEQHAHRTGSNRIILWKYAAAASIALMTGSIIFSYSLFSNNKELAGRIKALQTEHQVFVSQLQQHEREMHLMLDTSMAHIVLAGVPQHPGSKATVLWDTKTKDVYLAVNMIPPPPSGMQYQLWAIVDGIPVDLGMYDNNANERIQKMKAVPQAQMFAITLEKAGGSPVPTLDRMFVAGKT